MAKWLRTHDGDIINVDKAIYIGAFDGSRTFGGDDLEAADDDWYLYAGLPDLDNEWVRLHGGPWRTVEGAQAALYFRMHLNLNEEE